MNRLNRAKLLIIDDLGAERGTDYALEKVYDIIDSRYRSGKPAIHNKLNNAANERMYGHPV